MASDLLIASYSQTNINYIYYNIKDRSVYFIIPPPIAEVTPIIPSRSSVVQEELASKGYQPVTTDETGIITYTKNLETAIIYPDGSYIIRKDNTIEKYDSTGLKTSTIYLVKGKSYEVTVDGKFLVNGKPKDKYSEKEWNDYMKEFNDYYRDSHPSAEISKRDKDIQIGGKNFKVTSEYQFGRQIRTKITIDGIEIEITDNALKTLQRLGKAPEVEASNIVVEFSTQSADKLTTIKTKHVFEKDDTGLVKGLSQTAVTKETKDKEDNVIALTETVQTYKFDEKLGKNIPFETTRRVYEKKADEPTIDAQTSDFTSITVNSITEEPHSAVIRKDGNEYKVDYSGKEVLFFPQGASEGVPWNQLNAEDKQIFSELRNEHLRWSVRTSLANVQRLFSELQGLGYYATLFFDEDQLLQWRDRVDRVFATLYLGTEYWSSAICGNYLDGEDIGIAYAETPQGYAQIGAHVEATRTPPITGINATEFIYKITFNVRNGDYDKDPRAPEEMNINVVLKGQRTATVFVQDQKVKRGSSFGRVGSNAIVQDSNFLYTEVCITFDQIPLRWKLDNNELCNTIQESSSTPTSISQSQGGGATSGGGGSSINDF